MDPLDIFLPPAEKLLQNVQNVLAHKRIAHGALMLLADQTQNVAVTDHAAVFVKVYRRKDGVQEPIYTQLAKDYGAITPTLLAYTDWCSVWKYTELAPLPYRKLEEALASVNRVHKATAGLKLVEEVDYTLAKQVVLGRLTKVPQSSFARFIAAEIEELCEDLPVKTAGSSTVFTHGDLQFKNMGVFEDQAIVFDWEICKTASVEFELSKLEENLYTQKLWQPGLTSELYGSVLDEELLYLHTRLRYLQNMAFFLERGEKQLAIQGAQAYEKYCRVSR